MGSQHLHENEPELKESISQPSIPMEGLRTLARIISRHLERKSRQSNYKTDDTDKNKNDQIYRRGKEGHDG